MTQPNLPLPETLHHALEHHLRTKQNSGLLRHLIALPPAQPGKTTTQDGHQAINLTSNDYLGLSQHPDVISAAAKAAQIWGTGATASRLISGTKLVHQQLELQLGHFKSMPRVLLFPTGLQTNLGTLTALASVKVTFYSDAHNHASIVDGCRLSRAKTIVFRHRDLDHLQSLLKKHPRTGGTPVLVTDSVFSTTGAKADLQGLSEIARQTDALLFVDEAHATGVLGPNGAGLSAQLGIFPQIQTATLSKAFGAAGGFVATTDLLADFFVNEARAFIYTTALSPILAAASLQALRIIQSPEGQRLRTTLHHNAHLLATELRAQGWTVEHHTHIVSVVLHQPTPALQAAAALAHRGVFALPFRPPTVPEGNSLLRLAPSAVHTKADIFHVVRAFADIKDRFLSSTKHT